MSQNPAPGVMAPGRPIYRPSLSVRTGIVLAAFLGLADVVFGVLQLDPAQAIPPAVSIFLIAAGVGTIAAVPFAWRGAPWARYVAIILRLLSAMSGLPAFFVPGVPAELVIMAAVGILLAVLVAVLMLREGHEYHA